MTTRRVWSIAVLGVAALLAALLVISGDGPTDALLGGFGIAVFVTAWFAFGVGRIDDPRGAPLLVGSVAIAAALMVSVAPTMAIVQGIAYPIAWVFTRSVRRAVVNNIIVAVGVTIGFLVSLGVDSPALVQTAFTMAISLGFSLIMGFWIAHMNELGDRNGRLLAELQGAQSQIAALHRDAGATAEREHLARELHDTIAQDLTGLIMLAQRARRELGDAETLRMLEESARAVLAETRALVASGAALGSAETDLASALHRLAERFSRETGVEVRCDVAAHLALSRDVEVVVLPCVQEALSNARKHARASRIAVVVSVPDGEPRRVRVEIVDDGQGLDAATARDGFGLSGMANRLALVSGTLDVRSATGSGTTIVAELPAAGVTV